MPSNDGGASEPRVAGVLAGTIVPTVLSSIFVVARLYTRKFISDTWDVDDTLISIAWVVSLGLAFTNCLFVNYGSGHHEISMAPSDIIATMKLVFASHAIYQFVACTTKLGICSFYLRIFQDRQSKIVVYALLAFILVSTLATEFTFIFSCKPISGAWTLEEQNCLPVKPIFIANTVCGVVGDLALMIFVLPKIVPLQISRRQKVWLFSIVGLGFLVIAASIIRLIEIMRFNKSGAFTWEEVNLTTWTSIEVSTGLFCASVPCLRPLLRKMLPSLFTTISHTFTKSQTSPDDSEIKTIGSRHYSMQSRRSALITHLKKAFCSKAKTGLEEVKLKTIKSKRYSARTFAYAIKKREEAFDHDLDMTDWRGSPSVENWLGRIVDEEAVKMAAVGVALDEDGEHGLGRRIGEAISPMSLSSG